MFYMVWFREWFHMTFKKEKCFKHCLINFLCGFFVFPFYLWDFLFTKPLQTNPPGIKNEHTDV